MMQTVGGARSDPPQGHPLGDPGNWGLNAAGLFVSVLAVAVFVRFSVALDVVAPDRSRLFWLAVLLAIVSLAGIALCARAFERGGVRRSPVVGAIAVGVCGGFLYGLAVYPSDFHADVFGRLVGYAVVQGGLLLPLGALVFVVGIIRWRFFPHKDAGVSAGLAFVPVGVQIGFHGGLALALIASLEQLMVAAREANAPRESDAVSVLSFVALVFALHLLRRRGPQNNACWPPGATAAGSSKSAVFMRGVTG